jgi:hypothetical protein
MEFKNYALDRIYGKNALDFCIRKYLTDSRMLSIVFYFTLSPQIIFCVFSLCDGEIMV